MTVTDMDKSDPMDTNSCQTRNVAVAVKRNAAVAVNPDIFLICFLVFVMFSIVYLFVV